MARPPTSGWDEVRPLFTGLPSGFAPHRAHKAAEGAPCGQTPGDKQHDTFYSFLSGRPAAGGLAAPGPARLLLSIWPSSARPGAVGASPSPPRASTASAKPRKKLTTKNS